MNRKKAVHPRKIQQPTRDYAPETGMKSSSTYLACCGPTLPMSCAELAVICESLIAPDSMPNGFLHFSVIREGEEKGGKNLLVLTH